MSRVIIGSRGSSLALWQTNHIAARLREEHEGLEVETRVIRTEGDIQAETPMGSFGTGVFVRRLEEVLAAGEIDLAVHSLKDMPTEQPEGLCVAAVPQRHDARDALLTAAGLTLDALPEGAVVATGSPRRRCQLLHVRPDLRVVPVRGNVDTRVGKLLDGSFDALVLALAAVERLGITTVGVHPLDPRTCLPAAGQGALGLETREDDAETRRLVEVLNHAPSWHAVTAERSFLDRLGGGCLAPATGYAWIEGDRLTLEALVGEPGGGAIIFERESAEPDQAAFVGARLAERLLSAGAGEILRLARSDASQDHERA